MPFLLTFTEMCQAVRYATGDIEAAIIFDREIDSIYQHSLQNTIIIEDTVGGGGGGGGDDGDDGDDFDDLLDDELFGREDDEENDEVDASDFDSFADVPANNLVNLVENGLNFAEVNSDILATVDFNNIPAEDFQVLRDAGLSLTPLSTQALGNINLGVFKNFGYLSQVDLAQTRFNNLTVFGELSATFVTNANLYDYKSELEVDLGIDLDDLIQLSFSDFRAINYAFDGDEIFDSTYYTTQRGTGTLNGTNPFTDYIENGWRSEIDPHPLFDVSYYLAKNTDVQGAGDEPLTHYITKGFAEADNANRDPHPLFDTSYYNENNTDVVGANKNSLLHFVESGFSENFDSRDPNRFFDSSYYNINNPDVVAAGVNPLVHYIQFGWRESLNGTNPNRDPNPLFDTEFYFETHEDVKFEVLSNDNGSPYQYISANPLQHYIEFGDEGTIAIEERVTYPIFQADNQVAFTTVIDENSEGFPYVQNQFAQLNYELTPREQGGILVASPLLLNPVTLKAVEYTIYLGATYIAADQLDVPEGIGNLYQLFTQTSLYESISIGLTDLFTGTPPFPGDLIESTAVVESFPKGSRLENFLNLDGRFYTPIDPIEGLNENVESFPQRDEILEGLLDGPFVFPDVVEIQQQVYLIDNGNVNPFPVGSSSSMGIQEVNDFVSGLPTINTPTSRPSGLFEIEQTGSLNYTILTGQTDAQGNAETFNIDGFRGRVILDAKYIGNPTRSPYIINSQAPQFLKDNVLSQERSQFRRIADIISNPSIPFTELEVLVNDSQAVEYFESLLEEFNIPGQVRVVPTVVQ